MHLTWATRGRTWRNRFLLNGGHPDPLPEYRRVFQSITGTRDSVVRVDGNVAVRLVDPGGRNDESGRPITHDFVVYPPLADEIATVADGHDRVWRLVAEAYERLWLQSAPPTKRDIVEALGSDEADLRADAVGPPAPRAFRDGCRLGDGSEP